MAQTEIPVNDALAMLKKDFKKEEITRSLEARGYTLQQIADAMNQAEIKQGVQRNMPGQEEGYQDLDIPMPEQAPPEAMQQQAAPQQNSYQQQYAPQYQMPTQAAVNYDEVQALVEQIFEEKWKEMMRSVGDINVFKARVGDDMEAVKQELLRTQKRLEDLQVAVLGKVREYNDSVLGIGQDMKALGRITEELKKK